jgi:hypothetical protein
MTPTIREYKGRLAGLVGLSALGFVIHNFAEFGIGGLTDPNTATISTLVVMLAAFLVWWFIPQAKRFGLIALMTMAAMHLVGGAFLSVLPLPVGVLPFSPAQTLSHYLVHVVYGVLQLPLIGMGLWLFSLEYN